MIDAVDIYLIKITEEQKEKYNGCMGCINRKHCKEAKMKIYYISNIDRQIHNINDVKGKHKITQRDGWVEISLISESGEEVDSCELHSMESLVERIK